MMITKSQALEMANQFPDTEVGRAAAIHIKIELCVQFNLFAEMLDQLSLQEYDQQLSTIPDRADAGKNTEVLIFELLNEFPQLFQTQTATV